MSFAPPPLAVTEDQAIDALFLMDPLFTEPPMDLHEAAAHLGVLSGDLDRALWRWVVAQR